MIGKLIPERADFAKDKTFVKMYSDYTKDIKPPMFYLPNPSVVHHDYSEDAINIVKDRFPKAGDGIVSVKTILGHSATWCILVFVA